MFRNLFQFSLKWNLGTLLLAGSKISSVSCLYYTKFIWAAAHSGSFVLYAYTVKLQPTVAFTGFLVLDWLTLCYYHVYQIRLSIEISPSLYQTLVAFLVCHCYIYFWVKLLLLFNLKWAVFIILGSFVSLW